MLASWGHCKRTIIHQVTCKVTWLKSIPSHPQEQKSSVVIQSKLTFTPEIKGKSMRASVSFHWPPATFDEIPPSFNIYIPFHMAPSLCICIFCACFMKTAQWAVGCIQIIRDVLVSTSLNICSKVLCQICTLSQVLGQDGDILFRGPSLNPLQCVKRIGAGKHYKVVI